MPEKNPFYVAVDKKKNMVYVSFREGQSNGKVDVVPGVHLSVNKKGEVLGVEISPKNVLPIEVFENGNRERTKKSG